MHVVGVDGCPFGWVAAVFSSEDHHHDLILCDGFESVLKQVPSDATIVIDIPIGLLDHFVPGGRSCDKEARKILKKRSSCVFSPAARSVLNVEKWKDARGNGFTKQSLAILPKIRDVDRFITPKLQNRIFESHPELAFTSMAGAPLQTKKREDAGFIERLSVLRRIAANSPILVDVDRTFAEDLVRYSRAKVGRDDIVDAHALAWVAYRISAGLACRIPADPPCDIRGLRMEMWF